MIVLCHLVRQLRAVRDELRQQTRMDGNSRVLARELRVHLQRRLLCLGLELVDLALACTGRLGDDGREWSGCCSLCISPPDYIQTSQGLCSSSFLGFRVLQ
jgi:hypothetical protein